MAVETELLRFRVFQLGTGFFAAAALIAGILSLTLGVDDYGSGGTAIAAALYTTANIGIGFGGSLAVPFNSPLAATRGERAGFEAVEKRFAYLRAGLVHAVVSGLLGLGLAAVATVTILAFLDTDQPDPGLCLPPGLDEGKWGTLADDPRWPVNAALALSGTAMAGLQVVAGTFAARSAALLAPYSDEAAQVAHQRAGTANPGYGTLA